MKNILLTIFLCLGGVHAFSQTFTLTPKVSFGSTANSGGTEFFCTVKNNTTINTDTTFRWNILKYSPPSGWQISFCDPINCYAAISLGTNHDFTISKGGSGQMHITYLFNNTAGWDTLKVLIMSLVSSSYDTVTFISNAWKTAVRETSTLNDVSFYPNPVKDLLNVKFASNASSVIDIYNIIGVKVKSFVPEGNISKLNVADLKNGMYILRITDGKNTYSKTFNKSE